MDWIWTKRHIGIFGPWPGNNEKVAELFNQANGGQGKILSERHLNLAKNFVKGLKSELSC